MGWDFDVKKGKRGNPFPLAEALSILKRYDYNFIHSQGSDSRVFVRCNSKILGADNFTLYLDEKENVDSLDVNRGSGLLWYKFIFEILNKYGYEYHDGGPIQYVHGPDGIYNDGRMWYMKIKYSSEIGLIPVEVRREWKIREFAEQSNTPKQVIRLPKARFSYRALSSETRLFLWGMILTIVTTILTTYVKNWLDHH